MTREHTSPLVTIRHEALHEAAAIRQVHTLAFGRPGEAQLVDVLRASGHVTCSLVALQDAQVVGHILLTPVTITTDTTTVAAAGLGPLAVVPACQRRGLGARLVTAGLDACRHAGHHGVVVLGNPAYYRRFGFLPAHTYGLRSPFAVPAEAFMACALQPGAFAGRTGLVQYHPAFHSADLHP